MPPATIDGYMNDLIARCRSLYVKNPIAKYSPEGIGLPVSAAKLHDVFALGYCRDVIDIFDEDELEGARGRYLRAYQPNTDWQLVADAPLEAFPYLHHAVYTRAGPSSN
jgi:hypothetical protein